MIAVRCLVPVDGGRSCGAERASYQLLRIHYRRSHADDVIVCMAKIKSDQEACGHVLGADIDEHHATYHGRKKAKKK